MEDITVISKERKEKRHHALNEIAKILDGMVLGDAKYVLCEAQRRLGSNFRLKILSPEEK